MLNTLVSASPITGDVNGDAKVDIIDGVTIESAFGTKLGDQKWSPTADLNGDNFIVIQDIVL